MSAYGQSERFYTVQQVAAITRRPVRTVRNHCAAGVILGAELVGQSWIIPTESLPAYREYQAYDGLRGTRKPADVVDLATREVVTPRDAPEPGTRRVRHLSSVPDLRSAGTSAR